MPSGLEGCVTLGEATTLGVTAALGFAELPHADTRKNTAAAAETAPYLEADLVSMPRTRLAASRGSPSYGSPQLPPLISTSPVSAS